MNVSNELLEAIAKKIKENIGLRKLVMRWKDKDIEQYLEDNHSIRPSFYISRDASRIDNKSTFHESVIDGKKDEFIILIMPQLKWNKKDHERFLRMGYSYQDDVIWFYPKAPKTIAIKASEEKQYIYEDELCNRIETKSDVKVVFKGYNSVIKVGKNVKLPGKNIVLESDSNVYIGDNVKISSPRFTLNNKCSIKINNNTTIQSSIVIRDLSEIEIGEHCFIQTGKLRTGRNQRIKIGNDCLFSWDVVFIPHDGHLIYDVNTGCVLNNTIGNIRDSITIGDHVWVGGETVFLPNTNVRSGSICGYRSLVKGDFPNNCILAGAPATVKKKDVAWDWANVSESEDDYNLINPMYRKKTKLQ